MTAGKVQTNPYGVTPGQVWTDCDKRSKGRNLLVVHVFEDGQPWPYAECVTEAPKSRHVTIALRRFKPNATGYRLLHDTILSYRRTEPKP